MRDERRTSSFIPHPPSLIPSSEAALLGVQAAEALEHAHQLGVIHRDVKPANLLVDTRGNLWITDFGLAHCQTQAELTRTGDLVGTLRYMSPEQAQAQRAQVDHRTDIYSLGVSLYELLTLEPAFRGNDRQELLQQIAGQEPWPPRRLNKAIPRELETIVLKALSKSPAERYATAQELADDLRRFLDDRPIQARRPTLAQRLRRWLRRHKAVAVTAGLAGGLFLLLGLVALAVSNRSIAREKGRTEQALEQARTSAVAAEEQRQQAEANLLLARQAVDEIYTQLVEQCHDLPRMQALERELARKVLRFYQEFSNQRSTDPEIRLGIGRAHQRIAVIHQRWNQPGPAVVAYTQAIAVFQALADEFPGQPRYRRELASALAGLGGMPVTTIGKQQAEQTARAAVAILARLVQEQPCQPEDRKALAAAHNGLGRLLVQPREAAAEHRIAIELCEELVRQFTDRPWYRGELVSSYHLLGLALARTGDLEPAATSYRTGLALAHQALDSLKGSHYRHLIPALHLELARTLESLQQREAAEKSYRQAIAILEQYTTDYPSMPGYWKALFACQGNLAHLLAQSGRLEEKLALHHDALSLYGRVLATGLEEPGSPEVLDSLPRYLGNVLRTPNRPREMRQAYTRAAELSETLIARHRQRPDGWFLAGSWHQALGSLLAAAGRAPEAESAYRRALAHYRGALELEPRHWPSLQGLAWLLATCSDPQLRDADQAVTRALQAVELAPEMGRLWNTLGAAHYRAGNCKAAVAALEKALALDASGPESARGESFCTFFLAMSHFGLGHPEEARRWYQRALAWMDKKQPHDEQLHRFRAEAAGLLQK